MIERPDPQSNNLTPEVKHLDEVVQLFASAQYTYNHYPTHNDWEGKLHFSKPLGDKLYPHLHLTFQPVQNRFDLHLDIREHVATSISTYVSQGIEDLHTLLTSQIKSGDPQLEQTKQDLIKQCIEKALFRTATILTDLAEKNGHRPMYYKRRETKRRKLKKATKHALQSRKYKQMEGSEVWFISDWEPLPLDFGKTNKDRQKDE